jgi:hypothetical protein
MTHPRESILIRILVGTWMVFAATSAWASPGPTTHAPVIFWASDPVAPGETVLVTGSNLGDLRTLEVMRLPDDVAMQPVEAKMKWGDAVIAPVSQPADASLKFKLPESLARGVFAYRITTSSGTASGLVNAPIVHWLQGDLGPEASPGGWVRLFGRNLSVVGLSKSGLVPKLLFRGPRRVTEGFARR